MKPEPKTNAQRQADYRRRCRTRSEGYTATLSTQLDFAAKLHLEQLASYYGITQRQLLEQLIQERHATVTADLTDEQLDLYQEKKLHVTK